MGEHFVIKNIRRSIKEAQSRKGMIVGLPEIRIPACHAEVLLGEIDRLTAQIDASHALLAEARVEIERLSSPDYYACAMCPDIKQARQEAARTVERHLLGMFWCIPSKENEPMIYRDQAIEWLRGAFGLEG